MKIVRTDNYARETVAEGLVAENIRWGDEARIMLLALQRSPTRGDSDWYKLVADDYVLWRGMEEFV